MVSQYDVEIGSKVYRVESYSSAGAKQLAIKQFRDDKGVRLPINILIQLATVRKVKDTQKKKRVVEKLVSGE